MNGSRLGGRSLSSKCLLADVLLLLEILSLPRGALKGDAPMLAARRGFRRESALLLQSKVSRNRTCCLGYLTSYGLFPRFAASTGKVPEPSLAGSN